MLIAGDNRSSTLASCLAAAPTFLLDENKATQIMVKQITTIAGEWDRVCDEAKLSQTDKSLFAGRQFLNAYCIQDLGNQSATLHKAFEAARTKIST